ncbi:phospholipase A1-like isoform X1 [Onthophagus taurus]|uniref:phospholipase A1-like isoform X1 n=1 Tax=Onthophagus taurus TaxID=166361 RepID=UPI0039BDF5A9
MIIASNEFNNILVKNLFGLMIKMCVIFLINPTKYVKCARIGDLLPAEKAMGINLKLQRMCNSLTLVDRCPNENITFWLHTRDSIEPYQLKELSTNSFKKAPFFPKVPIKILVHGYAGNKHGTPNLELKPGKYLKKGYNVISMDYGPVVKHPCNLQCVRNLDVAGKCLANFIRTLLRKKIKRRKCKIKRSDIHLLGFGIGAQVAAKAAESIKKTVGSLPRVTALDPALPLFYGVKPSLSKKIADFVDVIHTATVLYAYLAPSGHSDYFVNTAICQGECTVTVSCTRGMSAVYYAESINGEGQFCGFDLFVSGNRVAMGEKATKNVTGSFGVFTNPTSPYARGCHEVDR